MAKLKPSTRAALKTTAQIKKRHLAANTLHGPGKSSEIRKVLADSLRFKRRQATRVANHPNKSEYRGTMKSYHKEIRDAYFKHRTA